MLWKKRYFGNLRRLTVLCWMLLLCFPLTPQSRTLELGNPFIRNYSPGDYDAHFQNWGVAQDKRGVMFFANGSGVLEFDGSSWRKIKLPGSVGVFSIASDSDGLIYVGALGQFGYLAPDNKGKLEFISLNDHLPENERDFADICSIGVNSKFICFKSLHKIYLYYPKKDKLVVFPRSTSPYVSVIRDETLVSDGQGIHVMKESGLQLLPGTSEIAYPKSGLTFVLPTDKPNNLLIATSRKGFFIYDRDQKQLNPFDTELDDYLLKHQLYNRAVVKDGYLFGTLRGGIIRMTTGGKKVWVLGKKQGLRKDNVLTIFLDRHKNLWAGLNNGIAHIELSSPLTRFAERKGLDEIVLTTARYQGRIYVGAFDGLFRMPQTPGGVRDTHPAMQRVANITTSCWDLLPGDDGLWVANNAGITRINNNQGTPAGVEGIAYFHKGLVYCMGRTPRFPGYIFMALREGMALLDVSVAETRFIKSGNLNDIKRVIRRIDCDKKGDLWLSTHNSGIIHLSFTGTQPVEFDIHRFTQIRGTPLEGGKVFCYGEEVFATALDKIFRYNFSQQSFESQKTMNQALLGKINRLYFLHADGNEPMLLNTDEGMATLKGEEFSTIPFSKVNGAVQDLMRDPDGITWISTSDGLYRFDPQQSKNYHRPYTALIRNVQHNNENILFGGYLPPQAEHGPGHQVKHRDNAFTFEFTATFYEHSDATRFSWKLEGYQSQWTPWTKDSKAVYTNLEEGDYHFKVKARNIFKIESTVASYLFTVAPPWYRSLLAYSLYIIFFFSSLGIAYIVHRQKVEKAVEEVHRKYDKCYLEPQKSDEYHHILLRFMEAKKPYLDPNLSLNSLAGAVGLQRHYISQVLNVNLKKNFWEFINEFRVIEALKVLCDPLKNDLSILQIAFRVGFNSGASFNRAFKRHTGTTPSKYRKNCQQEQIRD